MSRILIIDDDRMVCEILTRFIDSVGHEARQAFTLHQGREIIASEPFDLVILDVRLPDGNGLKAIPKIKQESSESPDNKKRIPFPELREFMDSVERKYLQDLLSHTGGNIKEVCRISGISRANIYARLKKYGIARRF